MPQTAFCALKGAMIRAAKNRWSCLPRGRYARTAALRSEMSCDSFSSSCDRIVDLLHRFSHFDSPPLGMKHRRCAGVSNRPKQHS